MGRKALIISCSAKRLAITLGERHGSWWQWCVVLLKFDIGCSAQCRCTAELKQEYWCKRFDKVM
jgi:hypothetical protein